MAEKLFNPEIYAQFHTIAGRMVHGKYALALYENCARYRPNKGFPGLTPMWRIEIIRKLLGAPESDYYKEFKVLNRKILKPAIAEINEHSDICIEIKDERTGRKVTGLQFQVSENPNKSQLQIPGMDHGEVIDALKNKTVKKCVEYGVGEGTAAKWLATHGEAYLLEKLELVSAYQSQ